MSPMLFGRMAVTLVCLIAVTSCARGPMPAECDPLPTVPSDEGLAPRAFAEARERVRLARAAIEKAERAWFTRNYDVAACKAARTSVADALRRRDAARALRERYEPGGAAVDEMIRVAYASLDGAALWLAAGLVDADTSARIEKDRGLLDDSRMALTVARAELEASGWDIPAEDPKVTALVAARTSAVNLMSSTETLAAEIAELAVRRCSRGKTDGVEVARAKNFHDWMILTGQAGAARAALVYAFEPETRACMAIEKVVARDDELIPGTDGETLYEWPIRGVVEQRVLVGWTPQGAWFVPRDGGWRSFKHQASVACPLAPRGCAAPKITRDDVTAKCMCSDADGVVGRERQVRYTWDPEGVVAEE